MPSEILYYPHFLPEPKWFRATLLFCDRVDSIVPEVCQDELDPESPTEELLDKDSSLLRMLSPRPRDLERVAEVTLEDARRFLAAREQRHPKRELGDLSKYVMVHGDKLGYHLRCRLSDMGLLRRSSREDAWLEVEPEVAEFILTRLADAMSENLGIPSVTDSFAGFACNSLHGVACEEIEQTDDVKKVSLLAASIRLLVPGNLDRIATSDYLEIRNRYTQLRLDLDALMRDLSEYHRIDHIRDAEELGRRIDEAALSISRKVEQIRSSRAIDKVRRWVPFGIGTLVSAAQPIVGPLWQVGLALGSKIVEVVGEYSSSRRERPGGHAETYRALADLQEELLRVPKVKRFIAPPPMPA